MSIGIGSYRDEDRLTAQPDKVGFSTRFFAGALIVGLALVGCDSDSTEPPASTANSGTVQETSAVAAEATTAWCKSALAEFDSRLPLEPSSLLDDLGSVPTTDMSITIVEEVTRALAQSRLELETGTDSDEGYEWSSTSLVSMISDICGTNLASITVAASPQT
jgi:hypothetical protein